MKLQVREETYKDAAKHYRTERNVAWEELKGIRAQHKAECEGLMVMVRFQTGNARHEYGRYQISAYYLREKEHE